MSANTSASQVTYGSYLRVPELLQLQHAQSTPEHPDELHFIVVHQSHELWFKLVLQDLERIVAALDADDPLTVCRILRRTNHVVAELVGQLETLNDLPPWSLNEFRGYLGTASGLQSEQFREIELLSGLRDEAHLQILRRLADGEIPPRVARRLEQRSLAAALLDAGARAGVEDWEEVYVHPERFGLFHLACEALMDYDQLWVGWRRAHVTMIERILGPSTRGTAGMALSYLLRTTEYRFLPQLWEIRHGLAVRGGGQLVDDGPRR